MGAADAVGRAGWWERGGVGGGAMGVCGGLGWDGGPGGWARLPDADPEPDPSPAAPTGGWLDGLDGLDGWSTSRSRSRPCGGGRKRMTSA
ncbi:hypothetical protein EG867_15720 [Enterococcus faecalis]|nr:hypothetical protein EG867_15720 [Enterococcus faecalis]